MCGVFFYLGKYYSLNELMPHFMASSSRGPDSSTLRSNQNNLIDPSFLGFHRLAIIDRSRQGDQPFEESNTTNTMVCNGEIYNHTFLRKKLKTPMAKSDCAVILPFYEKYGLHELVRRLDGDFAFIIVDNVKKQVHLGRDPVGVKPLFYCKTERGEIIVASEMKSIIGFNGKITMLPSGSTLTFHIEDNSMSFSSYWSPYFPFTKNIIYKKIHDKLICAVEKRLMTDRPLGLFLSGGLDSSLIAGITKKLLGNKISDIHSFSIGLKGSPDLENAQRVADFLKTKHHSVFFTVEEGISIIEKVICQLETYDITTIRASIPQYLLSKYIRENTDVRVVLSGEGSDELFGGYMYSHHCPGDAELQKDSERLVRELEMFDVLRTDRTTSGNGLEVRVPFLDRGFMKYILSLSGKWKNPNESSGLGKRIEKKILRDTFDFANNPYIPREILFRTKDAFSDACGYNWIPALQRHCNLLVTDEEFSFSECPTKEAYYYRKTFEKYYPTQSHILRHYWLPKWVENKNNEPSAKILNL